MNVDRPNDMSDLLPFAETGSRPFFDGIQRHVLMIQRCKHCRQYQLHGRTVCTECLADRLEWEESSGHGTIFSFVIMHQRYHLAFETPYNVAQIELREGPRLISRIVGIDNTEIRVGMSVIVTFTELTHEFTLPVFTPV